MRNVTKTVLQEKGINAISSKDTRSENSGKLSTTKQKKNKVASKDLGPKGRKKRKNGLSYKEIIVLLQMTRLMICCELKSVAKALFECINRSPGESYGRAAEKKLKRMEIFKN